MTDDKTDDKTSAEKDLLRLIEDPAESAASESEQAAGSDSAPDSAPDTGHGSDEADAHDAGKGSGSKLKEGSALDADSAADDEDQETEEPLSIKDKIMNILPFGKAGSAGGKRTQLEKKPFELKQLKSAAFINRSLIIVACLTFANFIFNLIGESRKSGDATNYMESVTRQIAEKSDGVQGVTESGPAKNTAGGADVVLARDIFHLKPVDKEVVEEKPRYFATLENFKLVGISMETDHAESYAMIENTETQITYFLKKDEELSGMRVVEIHDNKIVIDVNGDKTELR